MDYFLRLNNNIAHLKWKLSRKWRWQWFQIYTHGLWNIFILDQWPLQCYNWFGLTCHHITHMLDFRPRTQLLAMWLSNEFQKVIHHDFPWILGWFPANHGGFTCTTSLWDTDPQKSLQNCSLRNHFPMQKNKGNQWRVGAAHKGKWW